ncbi:hypothetical protein [Janthinobacterium sp. MP5059B]|uniref:hypothetical protein n=1 Tax=Janthinobacterium sp. MP5059B TaxID=1766683 RepID=UPI0008749121|nr:hypothetical protein [Janthinobacterium sp. MP5059B]
MISVPAPTRIAIGTAMVAGKQVEIYLTPEWARYFLSLNTQVVDTSEALGQIGLPGKDGASGAAGAFGAAGAALAFMDDSAGSADIIPGPPGIEGAAGAPGPALFFTAADPDSPEFTPGPPGPQGVPGPPGPAIFLLQDAESNDVLWPVKNT